MIIWFLSSQGGERLNKGRDYLIFFLTSRYYWILSSQAGFAYIELTEKSVIILRLHNQSWIISSIYQILNYFLKLSSNRLLGFLAAYIQNIYPRLEVVVVMQLVSNVYSTTMKPTFYKWYPHKFHFIGFYLNTYLSLRYSCPLALML